MVEYTLLASLLAVVSIGAITAAGDSVSDELGTMTAGISAPAAPWSGDGSGGSVGTTTTTTEAPPPTTTTTTSTTTTSTTSTTTTTMPPTEPPKIEASGKSNWQDKKAGEWRAVSEYENTSKKEVKLTIKVVSIAADGTTYTTTKVRKIEAGEDKKVKIYSTYYKKDDASEQIVSVVFTVISIETEDENGDDVVFETTEPVVTADVPKK